MVFPHREGEPHSQGVLPSTQAEFPHSQEESLTVSNCLNAAAALVEQGIALAEDVETSVKAVISELMATDQLSGIESMSCFLFTVGSKKVSLDEVTKLLRRTRHSVMCMYLVSPGQAIINQSKEKRQAFIEKLVSDVSEKLSTALGEFAALHNPQESQKVIQIGSIKGVKIELREWMRD